MPEAAANPGLIRVGDFLLSPRTGELWKDGVRVRLQDHPLAILTLLVANPSELVTREQIRQRLWPDGTVVDFEHGVNSAIKRLREALGDEADNPRFIETVPRRGYRLIASVELQGPAPAAAVAPSGASTPSRPGVDVPDAGRESSAVSAAPSTPHPVAALPASPSRRWPATLVIVLALLSVAVLLLIDVEMRRRPPDQASARYSIILPEEYPLAPGGAMFYAGDHLALAISPDGTRLAYVAITPGGTLICVRDNRTGKVTPVRGTEGGYSPFFSPDGAAIGFFASRHLKRADLEPSSQPLVLAETPNPHGGWWAADGFIYFNRFEQEGVFKVRERGGPVTAVTAGRHSTPQLLDDGQDLLVAIGGKTVGWIRGERVRTIGRGMSPRYVASGHILYGLPGRLVAAAFDRSSLQLTGQPVAIADDLRTGMYEAQFDVSREGTLVYAPGASEEYGHLVRVDRTGRSVPLGLPEARYSHFRVSPDGRRLAVTLEGDPALGGSEIWVHQLDGSSPPVRVSERSDTGAPASNRSPCWTPDGKSVAYFNDAGGVPRILLSPANGGGPAIQLSQLEGARSTDILYPHSFSSDGSWLSVYTRTNAGSLDISVIPLEWGGGTPKAGARQPFLATRWSEYYGEISPDSRWMLYTSDSSGQYATYLTAFPHPATSVPLSPAGALEASWNPNGREIALWSPPNMFTVDVTTGPELRVGEPKFLFKGDFADISGFGHAALPDGSGYILLENHAYFRPSRTINVITHVSTHLKSVVSPAR